MAAKAVLGRVAVAIEPPRNTLSLSRVDDTAYMRPYYNNSIYIIN